MAAASRPMSRLVSHGCELRPNTACTGLGIRWRRSFLLSAERDIASRPDADKPRFLGET